MNANPPDPDRGGLLTVATRSLLVAAMAAIVGPGPGCSSGTRVAPAVDPAAAREALTTALDAWKAGRPPASLRDGSPPIQVRDPDWEKGSRLADYEIARAEHDSRPCLHCTVKLRLRGQRKGEVEKEVYYNVWTGPKVAVVRTFLK